MTNGDSLRKKYNERLCEILYDLTRAECAMDVLARNQIVVCEADEYCLDCILRWLREEVQTDE